MSNIPEHIRAWIATEDGVARVIAIMSEMVFSTAAPMYNNHDVAARIEAAYRASMPDEFGRTLREKARDALAMLISIQERNRYISRETADEAHEHLRILWEVR